MSALHVVARPCVGPSPIPALALIPTLGDIVVDEVNLTTRVGEEQALTFLADLGYALGSILTTQRTRVSVPLHVDDELWEMGLEAREENVLISVFRPCRISTVAVFERALGITDLQRALLEAVALGLASRERLARSITAGLDGARLVLETLPTRAAQPPTPRCSVEVSAARRGFRLSVETTVRQSPPSTQTQTRLERADLHSLLFSGSLTMRMGLNHCVLTGCQVFLDVERLLTLAQEALTSLASARPTFRRTQLTRGRLSLRRGPGDAPVELRLERGTAGKPLVAEVPTDVFARVIAELAQRLTAAIEEKDAEQTRNLRLLNTKQLAQELLEQLNPPCEDETITNPAPQSYQRFLPRVRRTVGMWEGGAKMRFSPRWVATVPHIDLSATFLCGDRLIISSAQEVACLERHSGQILWKEHTRPAAAVVSPSGLVRIEADGTLTCHHLETGEARFGLQLKPRRGGRAAGSVLHGPGLPKLLALAEGDRQVTGIDLSSGNVLWRYTARRPGAYRVRRAGRLLIVGGGDPLLVAIDGTTGDVVWSLPSRLPFTGDVGLDHDVACALSGSPTGGWCLHQLNPWSGEQHWIRELDERPLSRAPLLTSQAIVIPTCDDKGTGAVAFHRETGEKLWEHAPGLAGKTTAWLAVDDCVLVNCARGVLLGLDAQTGGVRFSHVFPSECEADQPRRLEPVLRSGALFVPQQSVHVLRPLDGELLGSLPSDLVPDLIRVDERCDVYVAEESGHLAAFGAGPRLALVR